MFARYTEQRPSQPYYARTSPVSPLPVHTFSGPPLRSEDGGNQSTPTCLIAVFTLFFIIYVSVSNSHSADESSALFPQILSGEVLMNATVSQAIEEASDMISAEDGRPNQFSEAVKLAVAEAMKERLREKLKRKEEKLRKEPRDTKLSKAKKKQSKEGSQSAEESSLGYEEGIWSLEPGTEAEEAEEEAVSQQGKDSAKKPKKTVNITSCALVEKPGVSGEGCVVNEAAALPPCLPVFRDTEFLTLSRHTARAFQAALWPLSQATLSQLPPVDFLGRPAVSWEAGAGGGEEDKKENSGRKQGPPSCAVVSSSGALLGSGLGASIDVHDVVVRMNNAPTRGFERDVGTRTTLRYTDANYEGYRENDEEVVIAGSWCKSTESSRDLNCGLRALKRVLLKRAHPLNPLFLNHTARALGKTRPHKKQSGTHTRQEDEQAGDTSPWLPDPPPAAPSAGFMAVALALHSCGAVHLYGFNLRGGNTHPHSRWYYEDAMFHKNVTGPASSRKQTPDAEKLNHHAWTGKDWTFLSPSAVASTGSVTKSPKGSRAKSRHARRLVAAEQHLFDEGHPIDQKHLRSLLVELPQAEIAEQIKSTSTPSEYREYVKEKECLGQVLDMGLFSENVILD